MKINLMLKIILFINITICSFVERVIFIGLDGAGSFHQQIDTPEINKLLKSGVYTHRALAMNPTISGENWGSMLTGVEPSKHLLNNTIVSERPYPEDSQYPSIFKILSNSGEFDPRNLACFSMWSPLINGIIENSIPIYKISKSTDDEIFPDMLSYLKANGTKSNFIFFYFGDIDETGHKYNWMSQEYIDRYIKTDQYIKQILDTLDDMKIRDSTLIIITADHGGIGKAHGGNSFEETGVLWGVSGPNISSIELDAESVRNMDITSIILSYLGLSIPSYFDSKLPDILEELI